MTSEDRIAELERMRTMALRDLSAAHRRIADLERQGCRVTPDPAPGVCEDTVPALKRQVAMLTVSPVLPANKPEDQEILVNETGEWLSLPDRLEKFEEDNYWLKRENADLSRKVDELTARLAALQVERRAPAADPAAEKEAAFAFRAISVLRVAMRALPWALCGLAMWATWEKGFWVMAAWLLLAWNVGRFGPLFLFWRRFGTSRAPQVASR